MGSLRDMRHVNRRTYVVLCHGPYIEVKVRAKNHKEAIERARMYLTLEELDSISDYSTYCPDPDRNQ